MATKTFDVVTESTYTEASGKRVAVECSPCVVERRGSYGRFGTKREAEEYCRGRILYRGRYMTRPELVEKMAESREWSGCVVVSMPAGWRFIHVEGAEMFIKADAFQGIRQEAA